MEILEEVRKTKADHGRSVVLVLNNDGENTGLGYAFIIDQTGTRCLAMTNEHVIEGKGHIRVRLAGSSQGYVATVLHEHKDADLAILGFVVPENLILPVLKFCETCSNVRAGQKVFLVAYYHPQELKGMADVACLEPTVMPGKTCGSPLEWKENPIYTDIIHSCASQGGCSGAPLVCEAEVLGVHFESRGQFEAARSTKTVAIIMKHWIGLSENETCPPINVMVQSLVQRDQANQSIAQ